MTWEVAGSSPVGAYFFGDIMAKVNCEVEYVDLESGRGDTIEGVSVTCSKCGHCEESFGTTERSVRRSLVMLRENCPNLEENYYVSDEEEYIK
jgi:hypothetical protein